MTEQTFHDESVFIDNLLPPPVQVTLHSAKQIEKISKNISTKESIPEITVASYMGKQYVADGWARVEAFKLKRMNAITAKICEVDSIHEIIVLHVRLNQRSLINPLGVMRAAEFLESEGFERTSIAKILWLDDNHSRLLNNVSLCPKVADLLNKCLDELSHRYESIYLPSYVVESISKIPEPNQENAALTILKMIPENIPGHKFSFPTPDQIRLALSSFGKSVQERDPVIFELEDDNSEHDDTTEKKKQKSSTEKPNKNSSIPSMIPVSPKSLSHQEARAILGGVPHKALLVAPKAGMYVVDMKQHTMAMVTEQDNVTKIQGDYSRAICTIPDRHAQFLNLEEGGEAYFKLITTQKQLKSLATKIQNGLRILVVSNKKL